MNHFISGILKIVLLEASAALLLIDVLVPEKFRQERARAHAVLAGLMVFGWANWGSPRGGLSPFWMISCVVVILACGLLIGSAFGEDGKALAERFHVPEFARSKRNAVILTVVLSFGWVFVGTSRGELPLVHHWEQFHFYLGSKYQREVGSLNLYKAALLADRESAHVLDRVDRTRDLTNFEEISVSQALANADEVRGRFSPERWEEFKRDWVAMVNISPIDWSRALLDHGNSNSPAWAMFAVPLTKLIPITREGQALIGWIDMLLMLGLWLVVWQTFGHRIASIGLFMWAVPPNVFDFLAGSFLRWDWLFAIGLAACFVKMKRYAVAGGFFGFAVATKLFPIFFGVALGLRALLVWRETKKFAPEYVQFLKGTLIVGALSVVLSSAMFGFGAWKEYAERIQTAQTEKFYSIQYSLKTVFLQHAAPGTNWSHTIFPGDLAQRRDDVNSADYRLGMLVVQLLFTALIVVLLRRADDVEAFVMGPLLVFIWLTVNMYYWNMLGLLAMGLAMRAEKQRPALGMLLGLHVIFMIFYLYQHLNRGLTEGYAVAWMLCVLIIGTAIAEWRTLRQGTETA